MNTTKASRDNWWAVLMTVLATLYLFPELIFNAELVRTVGSAGASAADIHRLELFGRAISGIGVTLLVLDAIKGFPLRSKDRTLLLSLAVFLLLWPLVFFGQKYVIDKYLIEPSSAEQRQTAFLSLVVKDALAAQAVAVEGLPFDSDNPESPVSQTFLSLFGGLVYANNNVLEQIKQSRQELATAYVVNQTQAQVPELLAQHQQLSLKLRDAYTEHYQPAYNDYKQALLDSSNVAAREWGKVTAQLDEGWHDYQTMLEKADELASQQAEQAGPRIYEFLDYYHDRCVNDGKINARCRERAESRYKKQITQLGYGYIPHEHWLIEEDVSTGENVFNSLIAGVLTGGISLAAQALSAATGGDGGFKDKRYKYTNDTALYKLRLLQLPAFQQKFVDDYGYPLGLASRQAFLDYPETGKRVRAELRQADIRLSANWSLHDRASFDQAVLEKIARDAMQAWSDGLDEKAVALPPGLNWQQFHQHPEVLAYVNRQLSGEKLTHYNPEWSDAEFKRQVLEPKVREQAQQLLRELAAQQSAFADSGDFAERGKQSLRAVIVPPISMGLSLLLICLTLIKLPLRYLQLLIRQPSPMSQRVFRWAPVATLLAVIILPFAVLQPQFDRDYPGAASFLATVGESAHPSLAYGLEWTLRTQPVIAPLGNELSEVMYFEEKSAPLIDMLHKLDQSVALGTN